MKCRKLECVKKASGQGGKWRNTFALEKCCSYGHAGFEVGAPITSFVKDGGHIDLFCTQNNNGTAPEIAATLVIEHQNIGNEEIIQLLMGIRNNTHKNGCIII